MINKLGCALFVATVTLAGCGSSQPPETPTGVTVAADAPFTVSWSAATRASSYVVYRGTVAGDMSQKTLMTSSLTTTSYTDYSVESGSNYYYQITSLNSDGQSVPSSEVTIPLSAYNLSVAQSAGKTSLTWTPVSLTSGSVKYHVYRGTATGLLATKTELTSSAVSTTSYDDLTGTAGTRYYYQVKAVDANESQLLVYKELSVTAQ